MKRSINSDVPFRDARREIIKSITPTCDLPRKTYINRARASGARSVIHTRALSLVTYQLRDRARSRSRPFSAASESTVQEVLLTRSTRRAAAALEIAETYELVLALSPTPAHGSDTIDRPLPIVWRARRSASYKWYLIYLLAYAARVRRYMRYQAGHRIIVTSRPRVSFTRYAPTRLNFVLISPQLTALYETQ